jgi:2,4-didehydro-3-deoxy-L-rhamnonate hydrolase
MKGFLITVAALVVIAFALSVAVSLPRFDETLDPATAGDIAIAPVGEALTFARYRAADGSLRLLLVTQFRGGRVTGFDLRDDESVDNPDPITLFRSFGYDTIAQLVTVGAEPVTVDEAALELPFPTHAHNIGIGANYAEHGRESGAGEEPFVFPKFAQPTRYTSDVARLDSKLLDYEAELGLVVLDELTGPDPAPTAMGLVLANELTDRWALVRNMRPGTTMGTTGFADGKSRAGFAPIGPLLVIPRDLHAFYKTLELRLYVNGRLRQRDHAANMTWGPAEIISATFLRSTWPFHYRKEKIALMPGATLPAGTILFSGTPAGVIFRPLNLFNPWVYLRPGDEVVVSGDYLGTIRNRIVEADVPTR